MLDLYHGRFEANLLQFAYTLRNHAFLIGPGEVSLALESLDKISVADRHDVFWALQTVFAKSPSEQSRFAHFFEEYWEGGLLDPAAFNPQIAQLPQARKLQSMSLLDWDKGIDSDESVETMGYSRDEIIAKKDTTVQIHQVDALQKLVRRLAKQLASKPSRRWVASSRKGELTDLRRSIRKSISKGGELVDLKFKTRELGKTRILFVFDVSGSMMVYSHFLLQLAFAFVRQRHIGRTEVFGFSTDLYRLTLHLQRGGVEEAILAAKEAMPGRSGGTKIGSCLASLLEHYGNFIDPKTVIIINSDGWDTGDLEILQRSMRSLHERAYQLIWLNPLAASPGYEPTASGMKTALPYVDIFAPSHNFESLEQLERLLMKARA